jgi:hypothetical protein
VTHVDSLDVKQNIFRDIGGVIGNAFERPRHGEKTESVAKPLSV